MPVSVKHVPGTVVLTPIEQHGGYLVKRDDLANERGVLGGKARTLGVICRYIAANGIKGLTVYAARNSVTPATIGAVCYTYGVAACVHTAAAKAPFSTAYQDAIRNGVRVVEHAPGYMSVLAARARDQALADGYLAVALGLDFPPAILETAKQVANIPEGVRRIVTTVGSGHMLEGIVRGLEDAGRMIPILGVCIGKLPDCIVNMETPLHIELVEPALAFSKSCKNTKLGELELNPYYEAKCLPYLQPGDLFWVVAK